MDAYRVLACPNCSADLAPQNDHLACLGCSATFEHSASGQFDLRPTLPRDFTLVLRAPHQQTPQPQFPRALVANPQPQVDWAGFPVPLHMTRELLSYVPHSTGHSWALDVGCGSAPHRRVCEHAGYRYLGLDFSAPEADLLGDAHALPCRDGSVDLVLSIAVLEHLWQPLVALKEARRVLSNEGTLVGSAAFMEPLHADSYFHMSPLALRHCLEATGFEPVVIAPHPSWSGLRAIAAMHLFPHAPAVLAVAPVAPAEWLGDLWWMAARAAGFSRIGRRPRAAASGSFLFVAKPSI